VCTLALYFRVFDEYPLLIAANRDERYDRPSAAPRVWPTQPAILAGKDLVAGGTWLGINEHRLSVGILNRRLDSGQAPIPTRSRGLLCLDLLRLQSVAEARTWVHQLKETFEPFTVLFADPEEAWVAYNSGPQVKTYKLTEGLHVFSNAAAFEMRSEKVDRAHLQFARLLEEPQAGCCDKAAWVRFLRIALGDHTLGNGSNDPKEAICVHGDTSGTVSSTIIIYAQAAARWYLFNCPGSPCQRSFGDALELAVR
jgi:uncharacterized protein with NRDE domain